MSQPPNDISIGSAVFAQHISVTDTQTDTQTTLHVTSVAMGRMYTMHTMRPNNNRFAVICRCPPAATDQLLLV